MYRSTQVKDLDRRASQPTWGVDRSAEHHEGGDGNGVGYAEERTHLVLPAHGMVVMTPPRPSARAASSRLHTKG